ncbi:MAG: 2-C-methyl-D-erythritol 4-phosphate cytidylyltransferase [Clostridia bacterium]|nr:2-C-methyl-D-erythritol 4-phosphate cytidylyltransferase [Clostridia bacterium]
MKVTGIILAAGNSTRFGQNKNKNLFTVKGRPIIEYSVEAFNAADKVDDIILVIKEEEKEYFENIVNTMKLNKSVKYVYGGASRKASVYNAISQTTADYVVIHDGARPNIKLTYIDKSLEEMENFKGTTIAVKSKDTIKICDNSNVVQNTTNRQNTWLIQTPQCFDRNILKNAHEKFDLNDESITDDCMVLEKCGYQIKVIEGDYSNIKVTTFDDMSIVENI